MCECVKVRRVHVCVLGMRARSISCTAHDRPRWQRARAAAMMCGSRRSGLMQHAPCMMRKVVACFIMFQCEIRVYHHRLHHHHHHHRVVLDEHDAPVSVTAVDDNDASNNSKNIKDTALSDASPHTVDTSNTHTRNIIMWLDHRAAHEADDINASSHEVLRYVGGRVSVEMQTPKLLWLKRHHPQTWARARHFFDLPDFLTYRATGNQQRSLCSSACKWTFSKDGGWSRSYMELAGLGELAEEGFARLGGGGDEFTEPGSAVGMLTPRAAADLGLSMDVCVASGLIDAYAGALGILAVPSQVASKESAVTSNGSAAIALTSTLAIIAGTSSCHIAVSKDAHFAPGIWGPYDSVLLPGHHAVEGGQSAAGKLLDFIIETHPAYDDAKRAAEVEGAASIYAYLNKHLERMRDLRKLSCIGMLRELRGSCSALSTLTPQLLRPLRSAHQGRPCRSRLPRQPLTTGRRHSPWNDHRPYTLPRYRRPRHTLPCNHRRNRLRHPSHHRHSA